MADSSLDLSELAKAAKKKLQAVSYRFRQRVFCNASMCLKANFAFDHMTITVVH